MFTRDERRGLFFLAAVAAAGGLMRVVRAPAEAPGAPIVAPELSSGDIARQAQLARQAQELSRPLLPGERIDMDRATAQEIERLPRVGPALARRIVDERDARGPFGSLEGLKRVSGIGPSTLQGFERTTSFSGQARTVQAVKAVETVISLNSASVAELATLPGVGPGLAERIVTWRTAHGGFSEVQQLEQVPGIGHVRFTRLAPLVRVP